MHTYSRFRRRSKGMELGNTVICAWRSSLVDENITSFFHMTMRTFIPPADLIFYHHSMIDVVFYELLRSKGHDYWMPLWSQHGISKALILKLLNTILLLDQIGELVTKISAHSMQLQMRRR